MKIKKLSAAVLAAILIFAAALPASSAEPSTPKEEVVYVSLNADGSVREINVVNIFTLDKDGRITDYGRYQSLRNMTTTDEIGRSGETVTIDAKAGKLYYEGKLDSNVMPWNIAVKYYMDDVEYSAEKIAGMSGSLKITVRITQNTECTGSFFDGYALQLSLTLDGDQCKGISADGATVANVGKNKQITYTVLPGRGAEMEITAEASDFEMDGISVNGIPLSLDIGVDGDTLDEIDELFSAIDQLDLGAASLKDGVSELQSGLNSRLLPGAKEFQDGASKMQSGISDLAVGGKSLQAGAADLKDGVSALSDGAAALKAGSDKMQEALDALQSKSSELTDGSAEIKSALLQIQAALNGVSTDVGDLSALTDASSGIQSAIDTLAANLDLLNQSVSFDAYKSAMKAGGLDIDALKQSNRAAADELEQNVKTLTEQANVLTEAGLDASAVTAQIKQLTNIIALLKANNASIDGTESYLDTLRQSIAGLAQGAAALKANYTAFDAEIAGLAVSLRELVYNLSLLSAAVNTLTENDTKLDAGITGYTGAAAEITAGYKQISDTVLLLVTGTGELKVGADGLYAGAGTLVSGVSGLYAGSEELTDGAGTLTDGLDGLSDGVGALYEGAGKLKDGTSALRGETAGMDSLSDDISGLLKAIAGDAEISSFVSDKNTDVKSVQFVIKADGVKIAKTVETDAAKTERLTFWQKLLRLFGLY